MRPLILHPDPMLRLKSTALPPLPDWQEYAAELITAMHYYNGMGLSAIQLGDPFAVFAMRGIAEDYCLFMPKLIRESPQRVTEREGCLSLPGVEVMVSRPWAVTIRCLKADGEPVTYGFNGLQARVAAHEIGHIAGQLIIDLGEPLPGGEAA